MVGAARASPVPARAPDRAHAGRRRRDQAEQVATDLRWVDARLRASGPAGPSADLALIGTPRAERLRRVLAQQAHLLAPTDSPALADRHPLQPGQPRPGLGTPGQGPGRRPRTASAGQRMAAAGPDPPRHCSAPSLVTTAWWKRWRSPRTAPGSRPAALTRRCGSGTRPPARSAPSSPATTAVEAVAIAPDGTWLATAGHDGRSGSGTRPPACSAPSSTGHNSRVEAVAIAPDGTWLATAGHDEGSDLGCGHRPAARHPDRPPGR